MAIVYPLNDRDYGADDVAMYHATRTSGIFDNDDFACTATGADNNVTIGPGLAWIRESRFVGRVAAEKNTTVLDMGVANSTYPRIDAVVLRYEVGIGASLVAKNGVAAANPEPPQVVRTAAVIELHLYHVRREAGAASIPVSALTDVRMDSRYCGLMQDAVTPKETDGPKSVDGKDMNLVVEEGSYYGSTMENAGEAGPSVFQVEKYAPGWTVQTQKRIGDYGIIRIYTRASVGGIWGPWMRVLTNVLDGDILGDAAPEKGMNGQLFFVREGE